MKQLRTWPEVQAHAELWQSATPEEAARLPIGYLLSLEGADSILELAHAGEIARRWSHRHRSRPLRAGHLRPRHR